MARKIDLNSNKKGLVCSVLLCMGERSGNKNSKHELEKKQPLWPLFMDEVQLPQG